MDQALIQLYSQQHGGSIPYYAGFPRYQIGGSFLGGLLRFALPLFKSLGASALQVAANTAQDVVEGDAPIKESIFKHVKREVKRKLDDDSGTIYKQNDRPVTRYKKRRR
jgi:hypothetical protein